MPDVDITDKALIKLVNPSVPRLVSIAHNITVRATYIGISFRPTLFKVIERSSRVRFLTAFEEPFFLESISNPPKFAGSKITKAATQIKPPPNQATNARQR